MSNARDLAGVASNTDALATDSEIVSYLTTNSYATTSDITTAISNLVDAAPATLDTLNELAAALGDDPNFATTVTNSIATKLPLSGGTLTGTLTSPEVVVTGKTKSQSYVETYSDVETLALDCATANVFRHDLTADVTISFANVPSTGEAYAMTLIIEQHATTGYTITLPASIKWANGIAPVFSSGASKIDIFVLTTYDGGTTWFGFVSGQNMV